MSDWFTVEQIDDTTFVLSEYRHWEEPHCYLLCGSERSLLIDTGLGISNIYDEAAQLTTRPVIAAITHAHWDHIGGLKDLPEFYAPAEEVDWLTGSFPLPVEAVRKMLTERCDLPETFDVAQYQLFQGTPAKLLTDHTAIELGGRTVEALHTPGHSPGHLCFWERETGYLFTGDLAYQGTLFANYPSTNPAAYLASLEKVAALPVKRVLPGHHSLDIQPELLVRMRDAFRQLNTEGKLHHGGGTFDYGDWSLRL